MECCLSASGPTEMPLCCTVCLFCLLCVNRGHVGGKGPVLHPSLFYLSKPLCSLSSIFLQGSVVDVLTQEVKDRRGGGI